MCGARATITKVIKSVVLSWSANSRFYKIDEGTKSISSTCANQWCTLHVSQCVSQVTVADTKRRMTSLKLCETLTTDTDTDNFWNNYILKTTDNRLYMSNNHLTWKSEELPGAFVVVERFKSLHKERKNHPGRSQYPLNLQVLLRMSVVVLGVVPQCWFAGWIIPIHLF